MRIFIQVCDEGHSFTVYYEDEVRYGSFKFHVEQRIVVIQRRHGVPLPNWMLTRRFNDGIVTALDAFIANSIVGAVDETRYLFDVYDHSDHAMDAARYFQMGQEWNRKTSPHNLLTRSP